MTIDEIAHACHAANSAYCRIVGDPSLPPWEDLDDSYKESGRKGVAYALEGHTPREQHESWMRERTAQGWVYGPVLDRAAKIHPNLIPYYDLPEAQRKKDALFQAVVAALCDQAEKP
jgi:RyR domain